MQIPLDIAPDTTTVFNYAEDAVSNMQRVYGIGLDYSLASLGHVDAVLSEWREGGAPIEKITKSLFALGSYAGEVLCKHASGQWVVPPQYDHGELDSLFLFVRLPDGREWRPIAIAFQAMLEGPGNSLEASAKRLFATSS